MRKPRHREVKWLAVVARCGFQATDLQPGSVSPRAWTAPPGGGKALSKQIPPNHLPHQFPELGVVEGEKGTRTCFELGDGAEERGTPLGAGINEAYGVVAIV